MTDETSKDLMDRWKRGQEERRRGARETIGEHLARHSEIATIVVSYDGYGDDGQIKSIEYYSAGRDAVEEALEAVTGEAELEPLAIEDSGLDMAVESYACEVLPSGWELDAGSFGNIVLEAGTLKGMVFHDYRIEAIEHEEFEI